MDPASRLGEILFGLIMVLGATLTAGLTAEDGEKGARHLLKAALGCNIAWGIIDGVMYVMNCVTVRSGRARLLNKIRLTSDSAAALEIIRQDLEPKLASLAGSPERESLYQSILDHLRHGKPVRVSMTLEDFHGALVCCCLVIVSCLPAAVPFMIIPHNPGFALRVSNGLLIAMLFWIGYKWAQHAHTNRWASGLIMVAIGLMLVGVAALLGG
ncbi:MAG TPA: VIT1/CCC1 transporter family protein, partial [Verrucomicrobiae bacterium]